MMINKLNKQNFIYQIIHYDSDTHKQHYHTQFTNENKS